MVQLLESMMIVGIAELALAAVLTLLPTLGKRGRTLSEQLSRAPGVDLTLMLLTWGPWLAAGLIWGWIGVAGALLGQVAALYGWMLWHERAHREATKGPRLVKVHHRLVGPWPNQLSLWLTVVAVPVLWAVRLLEIFAYPVLVWLLDFPRYRHSEWVNLSRHKVQDLVGHDLAWCLYCDWMTSVWSLGSEMLRNVESFWCPIQFPDAAKRQHSRIEFPDVAGEWVPAEASVAEAAALLEEKYGSGQRSWFGHPERHATTNPLASHAGEVTELDEQHRELLLEHSQRPHHHQPMMDATHKAHGRTPVCNDRITVYLRVVDERITEISFQAQACPICVASASLMAQHLRGRGRTEAVRVYERLHQRMTSPVDDAANADEPWRDLAVLTRLRRFPQRVKCVTLPWHTLARALENGDRA